MRRSILTLATVALIAVGGATAAHAQTATVTVEPTTPAPGGPVTVTVTDAPEGETVLVRLGLEEESTTVDEAGAATVTIAAPSEPGEVIGSVNIGLADYPIRVTVQAATEETTTTTEPTETAEATETTEQPEETAQPLPDTGLDETATLVGLAAVLLAVGFMFTIITRRPAAIVTRGSVTHYRIDGRRR